MAVSSGAKKALVSVGVLAVIGALLVGIGHWRAHDLMAGDVVWHTKVDDGPQEAVVVRDRIYTYEDDRLAIRDLSTGRTVAEEYQDGILAHVGDSGHVALVDLEHVTVYDRDGRQQWHRALDDIYQPIAISLDGQVDAIVCSEQKKCSTVHFDASGRETSRTQRSSPDLAAPAFIGYGTLEDPLVRRVPTIATDIEPESHTVHQTRDGKPLGSPIQVMDDHVAAQVGDLLVGVDRKDGTCTFTATRAGAPAWKTSTRCPDLGFPEVDVFANRIYLNDRSEDAYEIVTADLQGRQASSFRIRTGPTSESERLQLSPTPNSVVLTLTDQISAYSPTTGKRLWVKKLNRTSHDALEKTKKIYPGIDVSGPVIDHYDNAPRTLAELAVGRDVPSYVHTFIDAESGDESAELAAPYGSIMQGLDDGRVLVLGPDDMWLVSP
ncbi:PQQ-binding-like beta-propeller repeat protein [Nocardioides sp. KC13]|uniref:PQQ-binding-like beta-propeller repeat protein n=1 Tax=Nocardioides turkmenicus TaxID=2711220 RepID=A0A6M1R4P1_9ACTN|nr:PQQ-binding-like beta-propeller repeat protein [Nocardioides sp. KC13]NGN92669.1 PQQ-binding-like beta-propeller repeat protein [Nocardioides sp. KC13]